MTAWTCLLPCVLMEAFWKTARRMGTHTGVCVCACVRLCCVCDLCFPYASCNARLSLPQPPSLNLHIANVRLPLLCFEATFAFTFNTRLRLICHRHSIFIIQTCQTFVCLFLMRSALLHFLQCVAEGHHHFEEGRAAAYGVQPNDAGQGTWFSSYACQGFYSHALSIELAKIIHTYVYMVHIRYF